MRFAVAGYNAVRHIQTQRCELSKQTMMPGSKKDATGDTVCVSGDCQAMQQMWITRTTSMNRVERTGNEDSVYEDVKQSVR